MSQQKVSGRTRDLVIFLNKAILWLSRHWSTIGNVVLGTVLGLAFLAPALMATGYTEAGQRVYRFLAPHDHQLPQRAYFLFSPQGRVQTYPLERLVAEGAIPGQLRAFVGKPDIGYKTALNHRMIAIFCGLVGGGILWAVFYWQPRMTIPRLLGLTLPLLIDAFSHIISENGSGFRVDNVWAATLTNHLLPPAFYSGTTIGSLNWLLRSVTGLLFGLGAVLYLYAYLDERFTRIRHQLEPKLRRIGAIK